MAKDALGREAKAEPIEFERFSLSQRVEHLVLIVSFLTLVLTGLPQKFYDAPWAYGLVLAMGGIDTTRFIHRTFAVVFIMEGVYHLESLLVGAIQGRLRPSMLPTLRDVHDALNMLRYSLGLVDQQPQFGRYDYRQKFEYWGVVLGGMVMVVTGLILWWPTVAIRFLPGEVVPAAKEAHSGQALLTLLVVVAWHLYGAHLSPLHFPCDTSIFSGKISKERILEGHPLEYKELMRE